MQLAALTGVLCVGAGLLVLPGSASGSTRAVVGNPMAGNLGFGTIVEKDAHLGSTETEGTVAVGGDLTFGQGYNVMIHDTGTYTAPGESKPTALLVGGRIDLAGSTADGVLKVQNDGYVHVGDMTGITAVDTDRNGAAVNTQIVAAGSAHNSTPRVELTTRQTPSSVGPFTSPIDFTSLFATYRARAREIADCPENVTLTDAAGDPLPQQSGFPAGTQGYVTLTPGRTNVLKLSGADLNHLSELSFRTPPTADTPFVVVVDPVTTPYLWHVPNLAGASGAQAPYMLWDFPDATSVTITGGDSLEGTVFAPSADLIDVDPSNIEGDIAVKSFDAGPDVAGAGPANAGEIHNFPFAAELSCTPSVSPTPTSSPTPTPTSTPTPTPTPSDTTKSPTPTHSGPSTSPTASPSTSRPAPTPSATASGGLAPTGADHRDAELLGLLGAAGLLGGGVLLLRGRRGRHS